MIEALMDWLERARVFDTATLDALRDDVRGADDPRQRLLAHPRVGCERLIEAALDVDGADEWICPGYALTERLGAGGVGVVYRAMRLDDGAQLAIKILHESVLAEADVLQRLEREVDVARRLSHPGLPWYGEVGRSRAGTPFIAMQLLAGRSLQELMRGGGPLPEATVWNLLGQLARVLEHLEASGVVHRDIKPGNVLLGDDGRAYLCDLGLALAPGRDDTLTAFGEVIGTPHFLAPERARGERDLTIAADVYSLGATLYFAACGEPPFDGNAPAVLMHKHESEAVPPPRVVNPGLDVALGDALLRMLAKRPQDRPSPVALAELAVG